MAIALLTLSAAGVHAATALAQDGPADFTWSVPDRMGVDRNHDGLLDYANRPDELPRGPWRVDFRVAVSACDRRAAYEWRMDGQVFHRRGDCAFTHSFADEGVHHVQLHVTGPNGARSTQADVTVQDWLIVSIGDSVASGEGNPDVAAKRLHGASWEDERCHRSALSGTAQAALALERGDPKTSVTFVHLACSGATIDEGLVGPYKGIDAPKRAQKLPAQIDGLRAVAAQRQVDAVLISVGANDVHFGPVAFFCALWPKCLSLRFDPKRPRRPRIRHKYDKLPVVVAKALGQLPGRYLALARELRAALVGRPMPYVYIAEYFDPTSSPEGDFCRILGISPDEAKWARRELLDPLNLAISKAATKNSWTVVPGVADAFQKHGYCASDRDRWVQKLGESITQHGLSKVGPWLAGTLHPNVLGHSATAALITGTLSRDLYRGGQPVPPGQEGHPKSHGGGSDVEAWGGAGLGGAALLYALGQGVAARRRRRGPPDEGAEEETDSADAAGPVAELDEDETLPRGYALTELVENSRDWVHRRVESIEFQEDGTVRRRVSVDFTLPPTAPKLVFPSGQMAVAPIAVLAKGALVNFDLRDESGAPLPLLTRRQNAQFAAAALMARARVAQPGSASPGPGLRDLLWKVVVGDPREAERSLDAMNQDQSPFAQAALADPAFLALAHTLASMFVVLVPLADSARPRRVIKYAYDEPLIGVSERFAWGRIRDVLKSRLGWEPWSGWFDVPNLGSAESVHLEVAAGRDLETAGQMLGSDRRGGPISGQRRPGFAPRAHLHIDEAGPGSMGLAMVWLRARRAGLLRGAPLIGLLTAAVLTAAWFALPELAREGRNAVPLFLVVPSVLAAYLGRPGEHPFASELLLGVRVLLLGAGLLAFASAGLAAAGASAAVLRWAIGIAAVLAWVVTGLLVECWRRPRAPVTSE